MAHTPGPWVTADKRFANGIRSEVEAESGTICSCIRTVNSPKNGGSRTWDEVDANATLIAAAPDLLAACQAALDYFNETRSGREWRDNGGEEPGLLRDAINKAEGKVE